MYRGLQTLIWNLHSGKMSITQQYKYRGVFCTSFLLEILNYSQEILPAATR